MQSIKVMIDVNPRDIPTLICSEEPLESTLDAQYTSAIAQSVAETLGVSEFLHHPERVHELRRILWEMDQAFAIENVEVIPLTSTS